MWQQEGSMGKPMAKLQKCSIPEGAGRGSPFSGRVAQQNLCEEQAILMAGHQTHQPPRTGYSPECGMRQMWVVEKEASAFAEP